MKKRLMTVVLACVTALALTACGDKEFSPVKGGLYVNDDHTVKSSYVEDFSGDGLNLDELKSMAQAEIEAYNQEKAGLNYYSVDQFKDQEGMEDTVLPISIENIAMDEENTNELVAILDYATAADYVAYNQDDITSGGGTTLAVGTVGDSPVSIEGSFVTIHGKTVELSEIMEESDYHVVYLDFAATVTVNGTVQYISTNVSCQTRNVVTTPGGEGAFIIFKQGRIWESWKRQWKKS